MRTERNLPGIRNGSVAKRQTRSKNPSTSKAFREFGATKSSSRPNSNRGLNRAGSHSNGGNRRHGEGRGSRVMWMMILIGVALSAGFVFALRSQINTHRIGQAEERLRVKLDEYTSQQKFLTLDQQRALNTGESARAGRQSGLDQLKLDREAALHSASVQRIVHQPPSPASSYQARSSPARSSQFRSSQAGQSNRLNGNGQNSLRSVKQPVKPNPTVRAVRAVRAVRDVSTTKVVKAVKAEKAVKSSAAKSNSASNRLKANAVKAKKQSNKIESTGRRP